MTFPSLILTAKNTIINLIFTLPVILLLMHRRYPQLHHRTRTQVDTITKSTQLKQYLTTTPTLFTSNPLHTPSHVTKSTKPSFHYIKKNYPLRSSSRCKIITYRLFSDTHYINTENPRGLNRDYIPIPPKQRRNPQKQYQQIQHR